MKIGKYKILLMFTISIIQLSQSIYAELTPNDHDVWMNEIYGHISNKPINQIIMPGSHHAGSYAFGPDDSWTLYPEAKSDHLPENEYYAGLKRKYQTQDINVYQQLSNGVRYLDTRLAHYRDQEKTLPANTPFTHHMSIVGASYDSVFKQVSDFIKGYNTLVGYGDLPSIDKIDDHRILLVNSQKEYFDYQDKRLVSQLHYYMGKFDTLTNTINWVDKGIYGVGKNPVIVNDYEDNGKNYLIELHQGSHGNSENNIYYSLGEISDDGFEMNGKGQYLTSGVTPSLSIFSYQKSKYLIEVHKSSKDNHLYYSFGRITPVDQYPYSTIRWTDPKRFNDNIMGTNPKIINIPQEINRSSDNLLLSYQGEGGKIVNAIIKPDDINPQVGNIDQNELKATAVDGLSNVTNFNISYDSNQLIVSYLDQANNKYSCLGKINKNGISWSQPKTIISTNPGVLYTGCIIGGKYLSFSKDQENLSSIWYQPFNISNDIISVANIETKRRDKEFIIINISHLYHVNNKTIDNLNSLINTYFGPWVFRKGTYSNARTKLSTLINAKKHVMIIIDDHSQENSEDAYKYAIRSFVNVWNGYSDSDPGNGISDRKYSGRKVIDNQYFDFLSNRLLNRKETGQNKIFVLEAMLTSKYPYLSRHNYEKEYQPIEQTALQSLETLLLDNGNVIEDDYARTSLTDYAIKLNSI